MALARQRLRAATGDGRGARRHSAARDADVDAGVDQNARLRILFLRRRPSLAAAGLHARVVLPRDARDSRAEAKGHGLMSARCDTWFERWFDTVLVVVWMLAIAAIAVTVLSAFVPIIGF